MKSTTKKNNVSKAMIYLKEHELFTLEDLDTSLQGVNE